MGGACGASETVLQRAWTKESSAWPKKGERRATPGTGPHQVVEQLLVVGRRVVRQLLAHGDAPQVVQQHPWPQYCHLGGVLHLRVRISHMHLHKSTNTHTSTYAHTHVHAHIHADVHQDEDGGYQECTKKKHMPGIYAGWESGVPHQEASLGPAKNFQCIMPEI